MRTNAAPNSEVSPFRPEDVAGGILTAIVESSDDAIIGKYLDGVILTWNRGPEGQLDELPTVLGCVIAGKRVEPYETVRRAKDGHLVEVSLTVSPITDATGQVVGASAIARDIGPQKRSDAALRASEARWRSVVESAVDGIVVIDARG